MNFLQFADTTFVNSFCLACTIITLLPFGNIQGFDFTVEKCVAICIAALTYLLKFSVLCSKGME